MSRRSWIDPAFEGKDDEAWGDLTAEPRGVDYTEVDVAGMPGMWVTPKGAAADRVLLCIHGGGFLSGSLYTHRKLLGHLAKRAGVRGLLFEYRLAPVATHPAQLDDVTAAYRWLLDRGIEPGHIAVVGDSAGGGACITVQLRARELGLPLPGAALLLSPWVAMETSGDSYRTNGELDPFFQRDAVATIASAFLGETGDPRDPMANPLYAELTGLAPTYIQVGGDETLLDDARRLADRARRAGVEVQLEVFPGMLHTFQMAAGRAPEADDALDRLAAWVRPILHAER
ncbi:alpha/beta hydrolase [Actinocatenispora rupis]|uniref:alpha/beta hydrolase n=1 Tax=Actinocatenispora rupis TaxID=519421 RepID=UPI001945A5C8|nr:alpha/beta hydrolase [Actinocatenispora rupis]